MLIYSELRPFISFPTHCIKYLLTSKFPINKNILNVTDTDTFNKPYFFAMINLSVYEWCYNKIASNKTFVAYTQFN